jgi:hypothetical protein
MQQALFVYGTLRDPDVLGAVLGRAFDRRAVMTAVAPGFRTVAYPGRSYPALLRAPGATAAGLLLLGLSRFELELLDAFEGTEYRRALLPVIVDAELHEVEAYLPSAAIPAVAPDWSLEDWQRRHKAAMLAAEAAEATERRTRLLARRPH